MSTLWPEYKTVIANKATPTNSNSSLWPDASTLIKRVEPIKPAPTPAVGLSGQTSFSKAPEKKGPLDFLSGLSKIPVMPLVNMGDIASAAKAAYDTAKTTFEDVVSRIGNVADMMDSSGVRLSDQEKAPGFSMYNNDGTKNPTYSEDIKARNNYLNNAPKTTPLKRATAMGSAAVGAANVAFLPVTAQMEAAKKIPILKYPAEGASYLFGKAGEVGSIVLGKGVDILPISQESKDTIKPLAEELGAFVAQLVGVKLGAKVAEKGINLKGLPISETTKSKISTGAQITAGLSMTPFSTAYGLVSARIITKIHERKEAGIEITPVESKKIINEVKQELPGIFEKNKTEIANTEISKSETAPSLEKITTPPRISDISNEVVWPDITKLKTDKKQLSEELKKYTEDFAKTEEGYRIYQEAAIAKENIVDFNAPIVSGIKQNPFYQKEGNIHDLMGSGYLMEKNGKFMVANPEQAKRYVEMGWNKKVEIDSLAHEAGFDNGNDFLEYNLAMSKESGNLSTAEKMTDKYLRENDPAYVEMTQELNNIKNKLKQYDQTRNAETISQSSKTTERIPKEAPKTSQEIGKPIIKENTNPSQGEGFLNAEKLKENTPDALQSRVFERLKTENSQLEGDLKYDTIKLNEEAKKSVELIKTDKEKAYRIAMGIEEAPDFLATTTNIAMAEKALLDGNNSLYSRLVKNRSLAQTRRGQEIVAEKGSVTDNSTAKYVKELISSRLDILGKRYLDNINLKGKGTPKEKAIKAIDEGVKKAKEKIKSKEMDIKEAQSLIDKLACI